MLNRHTRCCIAVLFALLAFARIAGAQHTIIKKGGQEVACRVLGGANGSLRYDPGSGERTIACGEVLAIIDERLMAHADPCAAALDKTTPNCASLLLKNGSVVKCEVRAALDTYWKIRTKDGERIEQDDNVVGTIMSNGEASFTDLKFAQQFMSDANTMRMINDVKQCPSGYGEVQTVRSQAKTLPRVQRAEKQAAIERAKANGGAGAAVKARMDTARGLMAEFDADKLTEQGMQKVKRLEGYMKTIVDGSVALAARQKQCEEADGLFEDPYKNQVETSSVPSGGGQVVRRKRSAHDYLVHLSLLGKKYTQVAVEFADLQYVGDIEEQPDGSYRGIISVQQVFAGEIDGVRVYGDVTTKNFEVIIKKYTKITVDGKKDLWDVFLGDISVVTTQRD